ncbi:MAG: NgoFVII family restriction endonuclease [Acidaminococcaceae bacterium]
MLYDLQARAIQENYIQMLETFGRLSRLFSENASPYLDSRIAENLFCLCLEATNLSRDDNTADAMKGRTGIGIKTWTGSYSQKIAEFDSLRPQYQDLSGIDLATAISVYRNQRIDVTTRLYNLNDFIYHCIVRGRGIIRIMECPLERINIGDIRILRENATSVSFTDGTNNYNFNKAKSTLFKRFNNLETLEQFNVDILDNPFELLRNLALANQTITIPGAINPEPIYPYIYLRLYAYDGNIYTGNKYVPEASGLNSWNANSTNRRRHPNEVYIPVYSEDWDRNPDFLPNRNTPFTLVLPNGSEISGKMCSGTPGREKGFMSNPNVNLGKWLLRDVLDIPEGTLVTYDMLQSKGIDSVRVEKITPTRFSINFTGVNSYENYMSESRENS